MKNKMELMQSAQRSAAETLGTVEPLALVKAKVEAFEQLAIHNDHFTEFVNFFDMARGAYQAMLTQPVKPAATAPAA